MFTHQVVVEVVHGARWQNGSLHGRALEHAFDFAANPADAERLPSSGQVSRGDRDKRWPALTPQNHENLISDSDSFDLLWSFCHEDA